MTINGTNDVPVLGVNQTTHTTGTLIETDVDTSDTHSFSVVNGRGTFGTLTVDPGTGAYTYTPQSGVQGMTLDPQTGTYSGTDTFEVQVADNHGGVDTRYITFTPTGSVTSPAQPGGQPTVTTVVPANPAVSNTAPAVTTTPATSPANSVTIDLAASSDTGVSNTDNLTRDTTPTISGTTAIPFSHVEILEGSKVVATTTSDATGHYSVDTPTLTDGVHSLTAQATGPAETSPTSSSGLDLTIDTATPVPTIAVDAITPDNVINAAEAGTNVDVTGIVAGEFSAGDTVTLTVGGQPHTGTVDAAGKFSISVPGSELQGATSVHAAVSTTDAAGNAGTASVDHGYTVDAGAPAVTVNAVALTNDNTPDITGTTDDPSAAIAVTVDGQTYTATNNGDGTWTLPGSQLRGHPIPDGASNPISVTATDASGNQGSASATAAIDTHISASIALDPITQDDVINAAEAGGTVTITGTVSGEYTIGDDVLVQIGHTVSHTAVEAGGHFAIDVSGADLSHSSNVHAGVHATDAAGNTVYKQVDRSYGVDSVASVKDDTASVVEDTQPSATGNVLTNDEQGLTVTNTGDQQGNYGTLTLNADGSYSYTLDSRAQALAAGAQQQESFTYEVTDAAGNTNQTTLTVDITGTNDAPVVSSAVSLLAGTEDTDVTLTSAELLAHATDIDQGETTQLSVHNLQADHGQITDNHDGTFTFHPDPDYNGPVSFNYNVQDPTGASTPATATMDLAAVADAPVVNVDIADTPDNVLNASEVAAAAISGTINAGSTLDSIEVTDGTHTLTVQGANVTVDASGNYRVTGVDLSSLSDGKLTVTAHATSADGTTGTSTDTITKDATVGNISVRVEDPGGDHLYSSAEVGSDGTVTATVSLPHDAVAGDILTVKSVDHVLTSQDIAAGHVDYQVSPGDGVIAILTDQAGNRSNVANVQVAALAPDHPSFVAPPVIHNYGVPTISATLGGSSSGSGGWALAGPNGQPVQQMSGKYGTLTIDPQTGQLNYEYSHATTMGQKAGGGTYSAGQVISQTDHDVFHVLLHSAQHGDVDVEVNVNIEFIHGRSGHNKDTTQLVGMTITDPSGADQHDGIPDQPDTFAATLDIADAPPEDLQALDSYMAFAVKGGSADADDIPVTETTSEGSSPLDGYLNAAGVDPSQVVAGHPQGTDPSLDPALLENSPADQAGDGSDLIEQTADMSDVEIPDHLLDPEHIHHDG